MDELDANIIRRTHFPSSLMNERPTYYSIAKNIKQNPSTVRNRIIKLRKSGVLKDIVAIPDSNLLEMNRVALMVSCQNHFADNVVKNMGAIRTLMGIHRVVQGTSGLVMEFMYETEKELDNDIAKVIEICGDANILFRSPIKGLCTLKDRKKYLPIMDRIIQSPLAGIDEISKSVGINRKTASKRIAEMSRQNAFSYEPVLSAFMNDNGILFIISTPIPEEIKGQMKTVIMKALGNNLLLVKDTFFGVLTFLGYCRNMHELNLVTESIMKDTGIQGIEPVIAFDSIWNYSESIKNRIQNSIELKT